MVANNECRSGGRDVLQTNYFDTIKQLDDNPEDGMKNTVQDALHERKFG
jgi:hypothetical protein